MEKKIKLTFWALEALFQMQYKTRILGFGYVSVCVYVEMMFIYRRFDSSIRILQDIEHSTFLYRFFLSLFSTVSFRVPLKIVRVDRNRMNRKKIVNCFVVDDGIHFIFDWYYCRQVVSAHGWQNNNIVLYEKKKKKNFVKKRKKKCQKDNGKDRNSYRNEQYECEKEKVKKNIVFQFWPFFVFLFFLLICGHIFHA